MLSGPTRQMSSVGCCRQIFLKLYQKQVLCSSQCNASRTLQTETSSTSNANTKGARTHSHTGRKFVSNMYQNLGNVYPTGNKLVCKSHKLFLFASIMQQCHLGGFNLLPLGQRVYDKLVKIIDHELEIIGCQKMSMTTLVPAKLWKKTERWNDMGNELFRIKDRKHVAFCLGPTHEEVITNLLASGPTLPYRRLPMKMYQITRKFRDEDSPKYGFLRSREFEMKDLYTFDATLEDAAETYQSVCTAYTRILDKLEMDYDIVIGSTGNIGGSMSHEFQIRADIGEDTIHVCKKCGFGANAETTEAKDKKCSESSCELLTPSSIEVGHSFLLGTKYSEPFNAKCVDKASKPSFYQMGCYGLGVSRIMQACVEVLSEANMIAWPRLIAPYQICIIPMEVSRVKT
ncbi:probable proline--tRNA ligase, mitochondrial [Mizuhopecten yessoensis]|uniref:probable proline--tRNA ligase, mitochondrial n=1 Tax=Mizuhopecten yessoensis TaxID=6573 RepID=UPI000B45BD23|nr:probable proline--tRNA ligase, mitochondrial [Mizuhopecten yessoensis]